MQQLLVITFDFVRPDEPPVSLAIGTLMAAIKANLGYGHEFVADHLSFNLYDQHALTADEMLVAITHRHDLQSLHAIAIGCYIWGDRFVCPLISALRSSGFAGKVRVCDRFKV
jgi:hypothetical protein